MQYEHSTTFVWLTLAISLGFGILIASKMGAHAADSPWVPLIKINVVLNMMDSQWLEKPTHIYVMFNGEYVNRTVDVTEELKHQIDPLRWDPVITIPFQFKRGELESSEIKKMGFTACVDSPSLVMPFCASSKIFKIADPNTIVLMLKNIGLRPETHINVNAIE